MLIETPFPTTTEVARALGVSLNRVRRIERMMYGDSAAGQVTARKTGRKAVRVTTVERAKLLPTRG